MSKELLKKLSELDGEVIELETTEPVVRYGLKTKKPTMRVTFYYAPQVDTKAGKESPSMNYNITQGRIRCDT